MTGGIRPRRGADLTGQTFGMLKALRPTRSDGKKLKWLFECKACGGCCEKVGTDVKKDDKKGRISNCGCITKALQSAKRISHGMSRHPAYAVYRSMLDRCRLPTHHAWANYGGRGITVCERWQESFEAFWEDMGPTYRRGLELDRRDNNGGYSPENCRWVTSKTNSSNKRGKVFIPTPWGEMTVARASELTGIGKTTILYRLKNGWAPDQLLTPPKNTKSTTL